MSRRSARLPSGLLTRACTCRWFVLALAEHGDGHAAAAAEMLENSALGGNGAGGGGIVQRHQQVVHPMSGHRFNRQRALAGGRQHHVNGQHFGDFRRQAQANQARGRQHHTLDVALGAVCAVGCQRCRAGRRLAARVGEGPQLGLPAQAAGADAPRPVNLRQPPTVPCRRRRPAPRRAAARRSRAGRSAGLSACLSCCAPPPRFRPRKSASSMSLTNSPLPPICGKGSWRLRSPAVLMTTISVCKPGVVPQQGSLPPSALARGPAGCRGFRYGRRAFGGVTARGPDRRGHG